MSTFDKIVVLFLVLWSMGLSITLSIKASHRMDAIEENIKAFSRLEAKQNELNNSLFEAIVEVAKKAVEK